MNYETLKKLKKILPSSLIESAISLEDIGVNEYAWKWHDAISVIEILVANKTPILGGDVYLYLDGKANYTRDNWYIEINPYEQDGVLINNSRDISIEYIKSFAIKNGEGYCYSIVF